MRFGTSWTNPTASLRHPRFRLIFIAQLARGHAQWTAVSVLPPVLLGIGAGATEIGMLWTLQFGPILLIAPIGGVIADRYSKAGTLTWLHAGLGVSSLALAGLLALNAVTIPLAMAAAGAFGILTALEMPVRQALISEVVPEEDLPNAIALHQVAFNITRIGSPAFATLLLLIGGDFVALAIGSVASFSAAVALSAVGPTRTVARLSLASVPANLTAGVRSTAASRTVRTVLIIVAVTAFFAMSFQAVIVLHLANELGLPPATHGIVISAIGVGTLVGAVLAAGAERISSWIWPAALGLCVAVVSFAFLGSLLLLIPASFVIGLTYGTLVAASNVLVQTSVPEEMRGRTMSHYLAVLNGALALGSLAYGLIADAVGTQIALILWPSAGIAILATCLALGVGHAFPQPGVERSNRSNLAQD